MKAWQVLQSVTPDATTAYTLQSLGRPLRMAFTVSAFATTTGLTPQLAAATNRAYGSRKRRSLVISAGGGPAQTQRHYRKTQAGRVSGVREAYRNKERRGSGGTGLDGGGGGGGNQTLAAAAGEEADRRRGVFESSERGGSWLQGENRPVSPGPTLLSYGCKNIAFSPYGEYWREMRKLFAVELVSARRVKAAWRARRDQVAILVRNLTRAVAEPVALDHYIFGLADGIIGAVAFGNIYGTEGFAHRKNFQHVLDDAMDMMVSFSAEDFFSNAAGRLVDRLTGLVARRERIFHDFDAYFEMVIEQHFDPCADHAASERRDHVKAILLDAFLGGIDTSSVTMVWAMSELIRAPRVMAKVQDEIRAVVVGDDRVHPDDLSKLKYLKLVTSSVRHVMIGGYDVPARTQVFVNAWAIGMDPASWDEPEVFDPERFEHKEVDFNGVHLELEPFGAGRRICAGMAMGAATVEFTLANLLHCFDWTLPERVAAETVELRGNKSSTVLHINFKWLIYGSHNHQPYNPRQKAKLQRRLIRVEGRGVQLLLLLLLPIASLLLVIGRDTGRRRRHLRLPPGPARLPVLGNLLQLGALPHRSLRALARRHGPVMMLRLGTVPAVVVSSPEAAQEVLRTHDAGCCSRPASPGPMRLSYGYKDVAFAPYDGYGRAARRLFVAELFSAPHVQAAWHARQDQVEKLIGKLTKSESKPVELNDHIFSLTDGIIGAVAFGSIYGTERFAGRKRFHHLLDDVMDMLASFSAEDFFPNTAAGRLVDHLTGLVARRERVFQQLDAFFEMVIEQHLDSSTTDSGGGGNLVDALIGLWKQGKQYGDLRFTREHVKAIIFDAFIGGIGTSSVTILWAMAELIRAPRVMRKVQGEIRAAVGGRDGGMVQPDDLPRLAYLKMVVKETLRLHPPATLLMPRETMRHVMIGGYDVPARTRVLVNAWAIGRDAARWEEPEVFDPDRFETKRVDFNGGHFELLPFGSGRRICPGIAMGAANVEFTLANLLHCFEWALPEGMSPEELSMEESGGLVLHRKAPLVLVPTRYNYTNEMEFS
uniref:4-hydroxyphenylacetaldehyde oxime monooxygenase n=1 Tax=Oryza punctata TaxID=4537 RepID=A0A0E0KLK4_ORYPU